MRVVVIISAGSSAVFILINQIIPLCVFRMSIGKQQIMAPPYRAGGKAVFILNLA
jgi:hypothetical protein